RDVTARGGGAGGARHPDEPSRAHRDPRGPDAASDVLRSAHDHEEEVAPALSEIPRRLCVVVWRRGAALGVRALPTAVFRFDGSAEDFPFHRWPESLLLERNGVTGR